MPARASSNARLRRSSFWALLSSIASRTCELELAAPMEGSQPKAALAHAPAAPAGQSVEGTPGTAAHTYRSAILGQPAAARKPCMHAERPHRIGALDELELLRVREVVQLGERARAVNAGLQHVYERFLNGWVGRGIRGARARASRPRRARRSSWPRRLPNGRRHGTHIAARKGQHEWGERAASPREKPAELTRAAARGDRPALSSMATDRRWGVTKCGKRTGWRTSRPSACSVRRGLLAARLTLHVAAFRGSPRHARRASPRTA